MPLLSPAAPLREEGEPTVRRTRIGCSCQSSESSIGTSIVSSGLPRPWKNQLWFSNWIQAAASALSVVAGLNVSRVISSSETLRALGVWRRGGFSGLIRLGSMLCVNSRPTEPMSGSSRSFQRPSGRRALSASGGGSSVRGFFSRLGLSKRFLSRRSSRSDSRLSDLRLTSGSSYHWRVRVILVKPFESARAGSALLISADPPPRGGVVSPVDNPLPLAAGHYSPRRGRNSSSQKRKKRSWSSPTC